MKETLQTISDRTGFSVSTISRVLAGKAETYRISYETVKKVKEEAERCGYQPSLLAKGLRMRRTHTIGLVVPSIANPYFADIASVIIAEARKMGYTTIIEDSGENESQQKSILADLVSRQVDGLLVVPCGDDSDYLEKIDREQVPVVQIDRYISHSPLSYVVSDNRMGGFKGTKLLLDSGHRRVACIQGVPDSSPSRERLAGYLEALEKSGLSKHAMVVGNDFTIENGYLETRLMMRKKPRPTAIFAMSNTIVLGVLMALGEAGLKVPDDISVVSFDDNIYLDYMSPAITRISQPTSEVGCMAVKVLIDRIADNQSVGHKEKLPVKTILRDSVREV